MKSFVRSHRTLLLGIVIAFVLLVTWAWFAGAARQQTSFRRTDERVAQAKQLLTKATKGSQRDRLGAIGSLANLKTNGVCAGDWWNQWQQTVVPDIKSAAGRCRAKEAKLASVTKAAAALQQYLAGQATLTMQLSALAVDATAKDWPAKAQAAAQSVKKTLDASRTVPSVEPVQKAAKSKIEVIITAWNSLTTASTKQDKTAYLTAEAALKQAYADVAAVSDIADAQLTKLFSAMTNAAKAL